jgi:hypothetical protein
MADDDVIWPLTLIPRVLAAFEDAKIGGIGTCQRVRRDLKGSLSHQIWNWLGAAYIERRNFEISATHVLVTVQGVCAGKMSHVNTRSPHPFLLASSRSAEASKVAANTSHLLDQTCRTGIAIRSRGCYPELGYDHDTGSEGPCSN